MKQAFIEQNFRPNTLAIIEKANDIIDDYSSQGYVLTVRQLYYQFVSKNLIKNTEQSYNRLVSIIAKGRMAGLIDWNAIEDRTRGIKSWLIEEDTNAVFNDIEYNIGLDYWDRQDRYVEVWVEKEALSDVIRIPSRRYRVPYMSCKGYMSASEAWRAGKRFERALGIGKQCVIIHLGDHDPSGLDMTRDNSDRTHLFSFANAGEIEVRRIALNYDQVEEYNPPPNPAKETDSRWKSYERKHGDTSWELDALEPRLLDKLITDEILRYIDPDIWDESVEEEQYLRSKLIKLRENWPEIEREILSRY